MFSFNGNKIITTSGGGMLVADDKALADRARYLATQAREPAPHYEHIEIGFNYRMSNLLAALGAAQLGRSIAASPPCAYQRVLPVSAVRSRGSRSCRWADYGEPNYG